MDAGDRDAFPEALAGSKSVHNATVQDTAAADRAPEGGPTSDSPSQTSARPPANPRVEFSPQAYAALETLARRKGKSVAETLRDALALEQWVEETRASGGRVLIERDGRVQELVAV